MIINPDKFQAIILDKKKSNLTNIPLTIDNQPMKSVSSAIKIQQFKLSSAYSNICGSAANQLYVLIRLESYLSFNAKRVLINSYIISNSNFYC